MENIVNVTKSSAIAIGILKKQISLEQINKISEMEEKYDVKYYGKV